MIRILCSVGLLDVPDRVIGFVIMIGIADRAIELTTADHMIHVISDCGMTIFANTCVLGC